LTSHTALKLSWEQGLDFSLELGNALFEAKKKRWEEREAKKKEDQSELQKSLQNLIEGEKERLAFTTRHFIELISNT